MSVVFEFQLTNDFQFPSRFAQRFGLAFPHTKVELPRVLGEGFIMERVLKHISQINETTKLATLLYQTKAQELIYLLISKLMDRPTSSATAVDQADASKIDAFRESILADVTLTPQLPLLAKSAGMSLTKMKLLFRQMFGDSIYNYYQAAKMNEAAYLLKSLTVSETGYKLGFSNLSHFTRLFEKHYEVKPKRFQDFLKAAKALIFSHTNLN